jgi:two-component system alkaline phosphatase synthesis response regulator PhoP
MQQAVDERELVLVADDEPHIVRALSFVLSKAGYRVCTAGDGGEALARIQSERPRLAFLDLMMPKFDGYEVCRRVKSDPDLARTYVIILTAKGQQADKACGMALGADEYITKPFSPTAIVKQVQRALGA